VGVKTGWFNNFEAVLAENGIVGKAIFHGQFSLSQVVESNLVINCIPLLNTYTTEQVLAAQEDFQHKGLHLVNLWEDVWRERQLQVLNRIRSLVGRNIRLHGRKTRILSINKQQADDFLSAFHIQGPALARYKYGLVHDDVLVAVATFSGTRLMRQHADGYRSAELIRFATKPGYTVTGGLTKLIKHFAAQVKTNDIMSYADRDWSTGKGYESAGFTFHSLIPAASLWLDTCTNKRYFQHRLPLSADNKVVKCDHINNRFIKIFNTGNLKYVLYLSKINA
jgi:hypothetical protein